MANLRLKKHIHRTDTVHGKANKIMAAQVDFGGQFSGEKCAL
jgi:hypothetical protein